MLSALIRSGLYVKTCLAEASGNPQKGPEDGLERLP